MVCLPPAAAAGPSGNGVATRREALHAAAAHLTAVAVLLRGAPESALAAPAADATPAVGPLQLDGPAKAAVAQAFCKAAEKSKARGCSPCGELGVAL